MDLKEAIQRRRSIRKYLDKEIEASDIKKIEDLIEEINTKSQLHFRIVYDDTKSFARMVKYGWFENVKQYIAIYGKNDKDLDRKAGYYGEELVLNLVILGLGTCWVAGTYDKKMAKSLKEDDERLVAIILFGYGEEVQSNRKSKTIQQVTKLYEDTPKWFKEGVEAALLAPTALNQQRFRIVYNNGECVIHPLIGHLTKLDAGIVQYHFELVSGKSAIVK